MFVSEEERQSPGGLIGFVLPLMVFGAVAGAVFPLLMDEVFTAGPALPETGAGFVLLVALALIFSWRVQRPVTAVVSALLLATLVTLTNAIITDPFSDSFLQLISFAAALVISRAAVESRAGPLPGWSSLFTAAVTLPVIFLLVFMTAGFFGFILYTATEIVGLNAGAPLTGEGRSVPYISATIFAGAMLGLIVALVRAQRVLIGTVRYALLWLARFALPIVVVIGAVLLLTRTLDYGSPFAPVQTFAPFFMGFVVHLVLALTYQGGRLRPPALWLRVSAWAAIILAPLLYLSRPLEFAALWRESLALIEDVRWEPFAMEILLAAAYSLFAVIGLFSGWIIRDRGWMPALAPLSALWLWLAAFGPLIAGLSFLAWRAF